MSLFQKVLKAGEGRKLKTLEQVVPLVADHEAEMQARSDGDLRALTATFRERLDRDDLFDAIDRRSVMIAPAAAGGIAVAPLQIPMTQLGNTRYQNIPITRAIPDRRLFAFDLETGRCPEVPGASVRTWRVRVEGDRVRVEL